MDTSQESEEEEIKKILNEEKVQKALTDTDFVKEGSLAGRKDTIRLAVYTLIFLLSGGLLYYSLEYRWLPISEKYIPLAQKLVFGVIMIALVLSLNRLLKQILSKKIDDRASAYNIKNLINFLSFVLILLIAISLIFSNWYATMVSFGVVSLILGLALQNPITSLFGWVYLLIRKPYEVGDRIKIGNVYGDVMNVGYLDTTLWEFGGDYLSGDHPSGKIIRFSNSKIFNEYVVNYSWPLFPFIWTEIKFYVSYTSDFNLISRLATEITENEVGEAMMRRVNRLKKILKDSMVQELEIKEKPSVIFHAHDNTWIEVTVRFLVEPKSSGTTKSLLFTHIMKELKNHPDVIIFPNTET